MDNKRSSINELIRVFNELKNLEWIVTPRRKTDGLLGNVFEDLIGKEEDNLSEADWRGIELKTTRNITKSMVTLFSKSPDSPKGANSYLRIKYGSINKEHGLRVLNTTISATGFNTHREGYSYKIDVDRVTKRLVLLVAKSNTMEIIDNTVYWNFDVLEKALSSKLKTIAIIYGDEKQEFGMNHIRFTMIKVIDGLNIVNMLEAIENGDLKLDIRIGVSLSGKNRGKTHDHGTGFRIDLNKLLNYANIIQTD
jgi:hypothetical protein